MNLNPIAGEVSNYLALACKETCKVELKVYNNGNGHSVGFDLLSSSFESNSGASELIIFDTNIISERLLLIITEAFKNKGFNKLIIRIESDSDLQTLQTSVIDAEFLVKIATVEMKYSDASVKVTKVQIKCSDDSVVNTSSLNGLYNIVTDLITFSDARNQAANDSAGTSVKLIQKSALFSASNNTNEVALHSPIIFNDSELYKNLLSITTDENLSKLTVTFDDHIWYENELVDIVKEGSTTIRITKSEHISPMAISDLVPLKVSIGSEVIVDVAADIKGGYEVIVLFEEATKEFKLVVRDEDTKQFIARGKTAFEEFINLEELSPSNPYVSSLRIFANVFNSLMPKSLSDVIKLKVKLQECFSLVKSLNGSERFYSDLDNCRHLIYDHIDEYVDEKRLTEIINKTVKGLDTILVLILDHYFKDNNFNNYKSEDLGQSNFF